MAIRVGFIICGNCNPQVQTGEFYRTIKTKVKADGKFTITSKDEPNLDYLIVISGCPIDCAEKPDGNYNKIDIAGGTAAWSSNDVGTLAEEVFEKLINKR